MAPVGGPAGVGAFRHRLSNNADSATLSSSLFAGRRVDTITELKYSTFVQAGENATSLRLQLDMNGDGFYQNNTIDEELVFEPRYNSGDTGPGGFPNQCAGVPGCIAQGSWQTWDARVGGWHSRRLNSNGPPLKSLDYWLAQPGYQNATVAQGASLVFKSGSYWPESNVYFDGLRVNGVTYDFEAQRVEITPDAEPGFLRQTQNGAGEVVEARTAANSFQQYSAAIEPYSGRGTLHHRIKDVGDRLLMTSGQLSGLPLGQLTSLSYATFLRSGNDGPFLSMYLDLNGDGVYQNNTVDDILNFLPDSQVAGHPMIPAGSVAAQCTGVCPKLKTWQVWDALNGGWYSRRAQGTDGLKTRRLDNWLAQPGYQNAKIATGNGIKIQSGSGFGRIDAFVDGINLNGVTFDFETQVITVSPQSPNGWVTTPLAGSRSGTSDRRQDFENAANAVFGTGALRHRSPTSHASEDLVAMTPLFAGQPLQNITELSYVAKVDTNSPGQAPILKVQVDYDGDNYYTTQAVDRLVIFEPEYQAPQYFHPDHSSDPSLSQCSSPCINKGQWQRWDVLGGGVYFGGEVAAGMHPWDDLLDAVQQPLVPSSAANITRGKVAFGERPISVETDNAFSNYDSSIDSITINGVTFDFEASVPEAQLDGERTQTEPYRLLANDTQTPSGNPFDVAVYGTCTKDDIFFSIESGTPGHNMYLGKIYLDSNANDVYDGRGQDRMISYSASGEIVEGDVGTPGAVPIPGAQAKLRADQRAIEIKLPRTLLGDAWFGYDILSENLGRNTSWPTDNYADLKGFIPSPCIPLPEEAFGATPIDCALYDADIRLIQYVLDRSASTRLKLGGTCDLTAAGAHGGTTTGIDTAALIASRDGVTIESLDLSKKATLQGSGIQAGIYVAPGVKDVTVRGLTFTNLSRPIVVQNSIRTTIGAATALEPLSPLGNRILGIGTMREGVLAVAAGPAATTSIKYGAGGLLSRSFATPIADDVNGAPGPNGQDLVDVKILGNYISYRPIGPFTETADVTGVVVRQQGSGRDGFGIDVSQNAVGLSGTEFPSFNLAGIRIHAGSNDPTFAHLQNIRVFKNTLGRIEELNLSAVDANLPDAGDLHSTGRTGIAIGRASNFVVQGNSIRTILSKVPGIDMPGGGIVVYDSFDGLLETNSVITIAGADTAKADLGAIGIVDNLMDLFAATSTGAGKPTRNIQVISNYTGWSGNGPSDVGAQRGLVVSGATFVKAQLNQFKTISDRSIRIGERIYGPGTPFGFVPSIAGQSVSHSDFCWNWLNTNRGNPGNENASNGPSNQIVYNSSGIGSTGNRFPNGNYHSGNASC